MQFLRAFEGNERSFTVEMRSSEYTAPTHKTFRDLWACFHKNLFSPTLHGAVRGNKDFSLVKDRSGRIRPWRWEEALERLILIAKDSKGEDWHNQQYINFTAAGIGQQQAKLDIQDNRHIVELKWEDNRPAYAVAECLKNYYLLLKTGPAYANHKLVVLAPSFYYDQHFAGCEDKKKQFLEALNNFAAEAGFNISLKKIDFSKEDFFQLARKVTPRFVVNESKSPKRKYDEIAKGVRFTVEHMDEELISRLISWTDL